MIPKGRKTHRSALSPSKRIRLAKGWSMTRLAGISGVGIARIRSLENFDADGYLGMEIRTLIRLAYALDCAPADIIPILEARPNSEKFRKELNVMDELGTRADVFQRRKIGKRKSVDEE